ncbi:MAG: lipopolysaccharide assembly protein LapA domain-containing protein [Nitrospira sp.]|nr:lipopolysaccharide assembly protein LapA domain-containing protein [Nitrospira sp.]
MPTLFIAFLFAILIAVFALQNTVAVTVHFLLWDYDTSLVLIILGSAMLGALLTFLASLGPRFTRAKQTRQLEETVRSQGERIRDLERIARGSHETSPPAP